MACGPNTTYNFFPPSDTNKSNLELDVSPVIGDYILRWDIDTLEATNSGANRISYPLLFILPTLPSAHHRDRRSCDASLRFFFITRTNMASSIATTFGALLLGGYCSAM